MLSLTATMKTADESSNLSKWYALLPQVSFTRTVIDDGTSYAIDQLVNYSLVLGISQLIRPMIRSVVSK